MDTDTVDPDICVWCKDEPADDVQMYDIETGERICGPCLADCRRWNRYVHFWTIVSTDIPEEARRAINRAAHEAGVEQFHEFDLAYEYLGATTSNASEGRVDHPER